MRSRHLFFMVGWLMSAKNRFRQLLRAFGFALISFGISAPGSAWAQHTVQDFTTQYPEPPPPDRFTVGGPASVRSDDGWDGNYMRLTPSAGSQQGTVFFDQTFSGTYDQITFSFQLRVDQSVNSGADGFGFAYLNSALHGTTGPSPIAPTFGEEPNLAGSFGIGFDTYNNGASDSNAEGSVSLHFNGASIGGSVPLDGTFNLESGLVITAFMDVQYFPAEGGSRVTVVLDDSFGGGSTFLTAYESVLVPGLAPYDGRIAYGARTGGAWNRQSIDNITADLVAGATTQSFSENFEVPPAFDPFVVGGTPFTLKNHGFQPRIESDVPGGTGVQPARLRLTDEAASLSSSIAFDQTSTNTQRIEAGFDLRITDGLALGRADGMSFMLLDAADYGTTGNTLPDGYQAFELPAFANALGVGFDTYTDGLGDGDQCVDCTGNIGNAINIYWNAALAAKVTLPLADINLGGGQFHHADVVVEEAVGGVNVSVTLTDGLDGSVHTPFVNQFVAGVVFDGGARAAFGARTGGAADFHELDNVNIQHVPEPSTWALVVIGSLGLVVARRRHRS
jgi:hypothetical protein